MEREQIVEHVADSEARSAAQLESLLELDDRRRPARHRLPLGARAREGQGDARDVLATRSPRRCCAGSSRPQLFERGLICRADDRGDPVVQISPPLVAGPQEFAEMVGILGEVLTEAWRKIN